jgi:hypothetical protein
MNRVPTLTGSTVIVDDIDMHPDISCYQEVFSLSSEVQKTLPVPAYCEFEKTFAGTPTPAAYFQHLWDIEPEGIRALGYKVLMHHIEDYPDRSGYLLSKRPKVIFNIRNSVSVALSSATAAARGIHNVRAADTKLRGVLQTAPPVVLDPQWVVNEVKYDEYWKKIWTERLRGTIDHIILDYDHYIQNRAAELNRCFEFLEQKAVPVADSRFVKVTSKAYADEIANKDDVIDALHRAGLDFSPLIQ